MDKLRCIIADDEPIARQILENYISELSNLELVASCKNAFEVMEVLQREPVDLLFLDINMPKISGLSLLKTMRQKPKVVITTAYPEYAVEGFELSVTDYLLKPFSLERFLQAIFKVQEQLKVQRPTVVSMKKEDVSSSIFVKSDKKIIKIDFDSIYHIEAYGNYIKIFTDKMILVPQTLSDFLERLPDNFLRVHKSYAINFDRLKFIDGNQLVLENDAKTPIGKSYRKALLDRV